MISHLTVHCDVQISRRPHGRKVLEPARTCTPVAGTSRIPRIARLMALAIHFDGLLTAGRVADYAEIARLGHVSRARVTQIMNLLLLAPDIQEEILFLATIERGREPLHLRQLQAIALEPDWAKQRRAWRVLLTD